MERYIYTLQQSRGINPKIFRHKLNFSKMRTRRSTEKARQAQDRAPKRPPRTETYSSASEDDDPLIEQEEELPQPRLEKRGRARDVSLSPPRKRTTKQWITPPIENDNFQEFSKTYDNDELPTVNWWDHRKRFPLTMGDLVSAERSYGIPSAQMSTWNQKLRRAANAVPTSEMLDATLTVEDLEAVHCPGTKKKSCAERIQERILRLAKKQIEHRREITLQRLRKEKFEREGPEPVSDLPEIDDDLSADSEPEVEDMKVKYSNLVASILSHVSGGEPFPEELHEEPESFKGVDPDESDRINSVTPIDDKRVVFSSRYKSLKPIDFTLQFRLPGWVDDEILNELLQDPALEHLEPHWIGIPGDIRLLLHMINAPHDAAYHFAHQNKGSMIEQHTRQWFLTINFNKTRPELVKKYERSPERMQEDVETLLSSYDPDVVRIISQIGQDFPAPLGSIRQWSILYSGSEVAPTTGYFHMHLLLSLTYIRYGPLQVRLHYPTIRTSLQKICDVAYFHAIGVKTPFGDDPLASEREKKRLEDYIKKAANYFSGNSTKDAAKEVQSQEAGSKRKQR